MKKSIIYSLFGFIAITSLFGCLPNDHNTYTGASLLEFKNHLRGVNSTVLTTLGISTTAANAQTDSSRTALINVRGTDTIYVQLVGPQVASPITVNYTVRASGTTAVEGTHFNFIPANARTLTIPANSSVGYILVGMVPNSIPVVGNSVLLTIDLNGAAGIDPSPNYKVFKLKLQR